MPARACHVAESSVNEPSEYVTISERARMWQCLTLNWGMMWECLTLSYVQMIYRAYFLIHQFMRYYQPAEIDPWHHICSSFFGY